MRNAKSKLFCRTISFSMIQFNTTFKEGCIRNSRHFFDFLISNCPRHLFVDSLIFYPCSRLRSEAVLRPARRCSLLTARCSLLTAHCSPLAVNNQRRRNIRQPQASCVNKGVLQRLELGFDIPFCFVGLFEF